MSRRKRSHLRFCSAVDLLCFSLLFLNSQHSEYLDLDWRNVRSLALLSACPLTWFDLEYGLVFKSNGYWISCSGSHDSLVGVFLRQNTVTAFKLGWMGRTICLFNRPWFSMMLIGACEKYFKWGPSWIPEYCNASMNASWSLLKEAWLHGSHINWPLIDRCWQVASESIGECAHSVEIFSPTWFTLMSDGMSESLLSTQ